MTARRYLPALLLLFVGSGCAALIYEVVWFQLLQLTIGSSAVSLGVLLGTFMGGMCLGSILLPRWISASHHPLKVYAYLELGIGLIGIFVLFGMPALTGLYTSIAGTGVIGILLRGLAAAICLLPPTLLMGATLPAMARWVKTTPEGVSWLGFFYGGNIAGAVLGSLTAGFYLLRVHDMLIATFAAVSLNVLVAAIALIISRTAPYEVAVEQSGAVEQPKGAWAIYVAIGISGMTALSAEVIWTRILSLLYGGTVYTFALILAVFLFGLGIGSSVGSALARNMARPRLALAWVQMLLAGAIAWSAYMLTQSLPYWPIDPSTSSSPWFTFQLDLVRSLWAMLPAAILWGASFPAGARLDRQRPSGSGAARRQRLRRQYHRRDRRFALGQPAAGRLAGQPERPAAADRAVGDGVAARTRRRIVGSLGNGAVARQDAPRQHAA